MKKKILVLGIAMMCIFSAGLFADSLWDSADAIADSSSSIVPAVTQVTVTETDGNGNAVTESTALVLMDETRTGRLTTRFFGSSDSEEIVRSYSDGLVFTPFSSWVSDYDELESTGVVEDINGVACQQYYFELDVDENGIFYHYYDEETGDMITVTGYVWISLDSGAPLKVLNEYSLGNLDVSQSIYFSEGDGQLIPELIVTEGSKYSTDGAYGMLEMSDFVVVEEITEVFSASSYSR